MTEYDRNGVELITAGKLSTSAVTLHLNGSHPKPDDVNLVILNHEGRQLVKVRWSGAVEYDPADLDEAAQVWWEAVRRLADDRCACNTTERADQAVTQ